MLEHKHVTLTDWKEQIDVEHEAFSYEGAPDKAMH